MAWESRFFSVAVIAWCTCGGIYQVLYVAVPRLIQVMQRGAGVEAAIGG